MSRTQSHTRPNINPQSTGFLSGIRLRLILTAVNSHARESQGSLLWSWFFPDHSRITSPIAAQFSSARLKEQNEGKNKVHGLTSQDRKNNWCLQNWSGLVQVEADFVNKRANINWKCVCYADRLLRHVCHTYCSDANQTAQVLGTSGFAKTKHNTILRTICIQMIQSAVLPHKYGNDKWLLDQLAAKEVKYEL